MDKKIGLLTYQDTINYGAALQCYALYNYIKHNANGYEIEVIDYKSEIYNQSYTIRGVIKNKKIKPKSKAKRIANIIISYSKKNKFKNFKKSISFSVPYDKNTITTIENKYEKLIIGSDQLWNYKINNYDSHYFLDFIKDKQKISTYATSIGLSKVDKFFIDNCKENISNYSNIAVREKEAKQIIEEHIGRNVLTVLDPVFLYSKDEWENLIQDKVDSGALYYIFNPKFASKANTFIKNKTELKHIVKINGSIKIRDYFDKNISLATNSGPIDFLNLINSSKLVLTDSFHCLAFSIILHKDFVVFIDDNIMETNSRLLNLLQITGLKSRIYNPNNNQILEPINWKDVDRKLSKEIKKSKDYLDKIIR